MLAPTYGYPCSFSGLYYFSLVVGLGIACLNETSRVRLDRDRTASHDLNRLLDGPGAKRVCFCAVWKYILG